MDEARLVELERLAAGATPGPWVVEPLEARFMPDPQRPTTDGISSADGIRDICRTDSGVYPPLLTDAQFICAAREAVPALVAEVRRLQARIRPLRIALEAVRTEGPQELSPEAWARVEAALAGCGGNWP